MKQIAIRLPSALLERAEKIIPRVSRADMSSVGIFRNVTRSDVLRLAILRGLDVLNKELPGAGKAKVVIRKRRRLHVPLYEVWIDYGRAALFDAGFKTLETAGRYVGMWIENRGDARGLSFAVKLPHGRWMYWNKELARWEKGGSPGRVNGKLHFISARSEM